MSLDQFFAHKLHTFESIEGFKNSLAVIIMAFITAVFLCVIVERAKKCLDFALTLYFIDFLLCIVYEGFPTTWAWWLIHLISLTISILLGEFLCSRRELEEIPMLDMFNSSKKRATLPT